MDLFLDWMNGRPSRRAPAEDLATDAEGRPLAFEQLGWRISYEGVGASSRGLPNRISAEKPGSRVRVSISERRD